MGRKLSRTSPHSDYPLFWNLASARDAAHFYPAIVALASKLLKRGQAPENIAHDMAYLARHAGFSDFVAPVVHRLSGGAA
jgi:hypothetical protein